MSIAGPSKIIQDGLVLYLDAANSKSFVSGSTTWTDISRNKSGSLINGPTFSSANGGSIVFDGTNDYISFASNPVATSQITVEAWVKMEATTPNAVGFILGREADLNSSYRLLYTPTSVAWVCATTNNAWYSAGTDVGASASILGKNTYIAATYNGSNNKIYINGILAATGSAISGNMRNNGTYYLIRSDTFNLDDGKGTIYSHRVYNRALSDSEVLQNYNVEKKKFGLS
jgi:hypothetical protein